MKNSSSKIRSAASDDEHSPYAPISVYENPALAGVFNKIAIACLLTALIVNYAVAFAATAEHLRNLFSEVVGLFDVDGGIRQRFLELQRFDAKSGYQFIAMLMSSLTFGLICGALFTVAYVRMVLFRNFAREWDGRAAIGFIFYVLGCLLGFYFLFIDKVELTGARYPGMARMFAWPIFPGLAALSLFSVALLVFIPGATFAKLIYWIRGKRNGT